MGLRLDLGCGLRPKPGFVGVDVSPESKAFLFWDLRRTPWPWGGGEVSEVWCLPGHALVDTPGGGRRIDSIRRGDFVIGRTGSTRVACVLKRRYAGPVYAVKAGASFMEVTAKHPVATPNGWLEADKLREAGQVLGIPSEIEPTDGVHGGDIFRAVMRLAAFGSCVPLAVAVSNLPATKSDGDFSLLAFADQVRQARGQSPRHRCRAAFHGQRRRRAPHAGFPGSDVHAARHVSSREDITAAEKNCLIAVGEHDLGLNLVGADIQPDEAFPVNDPGKVSKIRVLHIDELRSYHFSGTVYNLTTEDSTFGAGGILTHNCFHTFEHFTGLERMAFMDELWRVMEVGGKAEIVTPHWSSMRAVQDPTHQWPPVCEMSWAYFSRPWRESMKLGHYPIRCNFSAKLTLLVGESALADDPAHQLFLNEHTLNTVDDLKAVLTREP